MKLMIPKGWKKSLEPYFDKTCSIRKYTESTNAINEVIKSWTVQKGHGSIPCATGRLSGNSISMKDRTIRTNEKTAYLLGYFPEVKAGMRAVIEGKTYDIISAIADGADVFTIMVLKEVSA